MKNKVIIDRNKTVLAIGTDTTVPAGYEHLPNILWLDGRGVDINGAILITDVEVPEEVIPQLYRYDENKFTLIQSEVLRIQKQAIDDYSMELMDGGSL